MPDYAPEVHRMRDAAANSDWTDTGYVNPETIKAGYDTFDRMIATVRREAAAEALTAASDAVAGDEDMVINVALGGAPYVSSWLRERASAIRNETKEAK